MNCVDSPQIEGMLGEEQVWGLQSVRFGKC